MNLQQIKRVDREGRIGRMMQKNNVLGLMVAVFALLHAGGTLAQDAVKPAQEAPEVGWADAQAGYGWVQSWLRAEAGVPGDQDLPDRAVQGLFGVYVTLRDDGRVMGRGQAIRSDIKAAIDAAGPPIQVAPMLAAATRQAVEELKDKQMKRAIELNIADPELLQIAIRDAHQRVQLDIQFGYNLESVVVPGNAPDEAVFSTFAPGFHGLRLAGPLAGKADFAWPAIELSRNNTAPRQIYRLMDLQGYDADELPLVGRADGPALQRFEVIHLVRPGAAQPMRQLTRGNVVLQQQVVDSRTIAGLAEHVAQYLDRLISTDRVSGNEVVRGTYQPSLQRYAPKLADARETALLAYALTRYSSVALDANLAGDAMRARATLALRLVDQLSPQAAPQGRPPKHLTAAFLLLTLCETPNALRPDQLPRRDQLAKALLELENPNGGGFLAEKGGEQVLSRASTAVIAAGLASYYEDTGSKTLAKPLWDVLNALIEANENDPRVVDLLWVAHALDAAGPLLVKAQPDPAAAAKKYDSWRKTLADYLDLLIEQQIRSKPLLGPEDVIGGFVFKKPIPGSPPEPNWQSAMPTALLALSLRDEGIVPADRQFGPVLAAGLGARFLGQLIYTTPSTYYLRDPEPAMGGVRRTLWDNTLYPDCSSITLIALAELQESLLKLEPDEDQ
jgi:hypothetical protein